VRVCAAAPTPVRLPDSASAAVNKRRLLSAAELAAYAPRAEALQPELSQSALAVSPTSPRVSAVAAARRRITLCLSFASNSRSSPPPAPPPPPPPMPPPPTTAAPVPPGLIVQITALLIKAPVEEQHFFWAASCCEAFLRGNSPKDQALLAQVGLLSRLASGMLACATAPLAPGSVLQVTSDLLGELVRFNPPLVAQLDELLCGGGPATTAALHRLLLGQLVDTNVLLRSLILSMHAIITDDLAAQAAAAAALGTAEMDVDTPADDDDAPPPLRCAWLGGCRVPPGSLFAWLAESWLELLASLMGSVCAESEVDSENVCLVNTALVMLARECIPLGGVPCFDADARPNLAAHCSHPPGWALARRARRAASDASRRRRPAAANVRCIFAPSPGLAPALLLLASQSRARPPQPGVLHAHAVCRLGSRRRRPSRPIHGAKLALLCRMSAATGHPMESFLTQHPDISRNPSQKGLVTIFGSKYPHRYGEPRQTNPSNFISGKM